MTRLKLNVQETLRDIRAGLDDAALMEKYSLSAKGLLYLFTKLVEAGFITQLELDSRISAFERTVELSLGLPELTPPLPRRSARAVRAPIASPVKAPAIPPPDDPVLVASRQGVLKEVQRHIKEGASANARGRWGMTPLIWAASKGHFEISRYLLAKGADVNLPSNNNSTALMWAGFAGHEKVVRLLSDYGADVDARSVQGKTALIAAAHNGHYGVVKFLLTKGANLIAKDIAYKTALDYAKANNHPEIVNLIVKHYKSHR